MRYELKDAQPAQLDETDFRETAAADPIVDMPPPPAWLIRFGLRWRVGFAIFIALSAVLSLVGCSSVKGSTPWRPAAQLVSEAIIKQMLQDHSRAPPPTELNPAMGQIRAWEAAGRVGRLVVFDFATPDLCGALGCLYVGVWMQDDERVDPVFAVYLNPHLPPGMPLLATTDGVGFTAEEPPLPCLRINQLEGDQLAQLSYCYTGASNGYEGVDRTVIKLEEEAPARI